MEKGKLQLKFPFSDLTSNCLVLMQERNNLVKDLPRKSKILIPTLSFKTIELRFYDVLLKGIFLHDVKKREINLLVFLHSCKNSYFPNSME